MEVWCFGCNKRPINTQRRDRGGTGPHLVRVHQLLPSDGGVQHHNVCQAAVKPELLVRELAQQHRLGALQVPTAHGNHSLGRHLACSHSTISSGNTKSYVSKFNVNTLSNANRATG